MSEEEFVLGDRVHFTGTVEKRNSFRMYYPSPEDIFDVGGIRGIYYEDAGLPGFPGFAWTKPLEEADTFHPVSEGVVVGKRRYRSMEADEGIWIPNMKQDFVAYLVAWHLSRKPVIVRPDQMRKETDV